MTNPSDAGKLIRDHEFKPNPYAPERCAHPYGREFPRCGQPEAMHAKGEPKGLHVDRDVKEAAQVDRALERSWGYDTELGEIGSPEAAPVSAEARALCDWFVPYSHSPLTCLRCEKIQSALTSYAERQVKEAQQVAKGCAGIEDHSITSREAMVGVERDLPAIVHCEGCQENADLRAQVERLTEERQGLYEQLSEVVTIKQVDGLEWKQGDVPIMRGTPDLPVFIAMLHNYAAQFQDERDTALKSLAEQRALVDKLVEALHIARSYVAEDAADWLNADVDLAAVDAALAEAEKAKGAQL